MGANSLIKTSEGTTSVSNEARLLTNQRKLFLRNITDDSADELIRSIMVLQAEDEREPIDLSRSGHKPMLDDRYNTLDDENYKQMIAYTKESPRHEMIGLSIFDQLRHRRDALEGARGD